MWVNFIGDIGKFEVTVKNRLTGTILPIQLFDYVIVASGHYSCPNYPDDIIGLDSFKVAKLLCILESLTFRVFTSILQIFSVKY